MANPCVITIGERNSEGAAAFSSIGDADLTRLFGTTITAITAAGAPSNVVAPGIKTWTPLMPFNNGAKSGTATAGTNTQLLGSGFAAGDDEKLAVIIGGTGVGQTRRVSAFVSATELTVTPAWSPNIDNTSRYVVLDGGVTTTATSTVATVTTALWTPSAFIGAVLVYVTGTAIGQQRTITANTGTTITVGTAFSPAPTTGDTCVVYNAGSRTVATYTGSFADRKYYKDSGAIVYTAGNEYSNFNSLPYWSPSVRPDTFGPDLELGWRVVNYFGQTLYWIHLGVPSAWLSTSYAAIGNADFSWYQAAKHNDWSPSSSNSDGSDDLYGVFVNTILAAAKTAAVSAGVTLDVIGVFVNEGDSDANVDGRYQFCKQNMKTLRDTLRAAINTQNLTTRQAGKIPWIIAGIPTGSFASNVNADYQALAQDDPYTGYVDPTAFTAVAGVYTTSGALDLGRSFYTTWLTQWTRDRDANTPESTRSTLLSIRNEVKARYEGNQVNTDATNARVNSAINSSIRQILMTLKHSAWFIRRVETMTITATEYTPFTMPAEVADLIQIRDSVLPHSEYKFYEVGRTSEGRVQITMPLTPSTPTTCLVDFMCNVPDLVNDGDYCVIPFEYIELLIVLAVQRLAERGGNEKYWQLMEIQSQKLWKAVWRAANAADRARNSFWHTETTDSPSRPWALARDGWGFYY